MWVIYLNIIYISPISFRYHLIYLNIYIIISDVIYIMYDHRVIIDIHWHSYDYYPNVGMPWLPSPVITIFIGGMYKPFPNGWFIYHAWFYPH